MRKTKKYQEKKFFKKRDLLLPKTKIRSSDLGSRLEHRRIK